MVEFPCFQACSLSSVDAQTSTLGCASLTGGSLGQLKPVAIVTSTTSLLTLDLR